MRLLRLVSAFAATPWAMQIETLQALTAIIERASVYGHTSAEDIAAAVAARPDKQAYATLGARENVAVIPVHGVIAHRAGMVMDVSSGAGSSTEMLDAMIRSAAADPNVRSIVLDIDSPGGSVFGVSELAATIMEARAQKPIAAVANSLAASAAYWIGTAAHELYVTPSGEVGSVGVYAAHVDLSKAEEMAGQKTTLISAGKYKTEGSPFAPLSDDAKSHMQARVDDYYTQFIKSIAKQRGVSVDAVRGGFGEGRTVGSETAIKSGMADGIATLSEVISKYGRRTAETANKSRALEARIALAAAY